MSKQVMCTTLEGTVNNPDASQTDITAAEQDMKSIGCTSSDERSTLAKAWNHQDKEIKKLATGGSMGGSTGGNKGGNSGGDEGVVFVIVLITGVAFLGFMWYKGKF